MWKVKLATVGFPVVCLRVASWEIKPPLEDFRQNAVVGALSPCPYGASCLAAPVFSRRTRQTFVRREVRGGLATEDELGSATIPTQ